MKIAIDLDDTLLDFLSALIRWHNVIYGTSLKREDFHSYKFWDVWGGTREEAIQKVYDFYKTPFFENMKPVKGAQEAVKFLKEENEEFVLSSRQNDVDNASRKQIEHYFPNVFLDSYFTNHYSQNGSSKSKGEICDFLGIDVLIEDSVEHIQECISPKRKILMLNCPWNKNYNPPRGVYAVNSWKEITEILSNPDF